MLFNSADFAIFLPVVFLLYWFACRESIKLQNLLLLVSSYVFYGWWDWRFLSLILFSSVLDYSLGLSISREKRRSRRKLLLFISLFVNLGLLGFFKYFNFFAESFADAFTFFGMPFEPSRLEVILPVGISFYTFQTLSYTIDVYRGKMEPTKDVTGFFTFVSFFPQLVAGPIERASHLLPQFSAPRTFDYESASNGMRQILWGLFKKTVIADNCAEVVNQLFENYDDASGSTLFLGALFFAFQIYSDFSGYSDIAIGTARLFGFDLMRNFAFPYFSRDIAEFWRRWHISLSTWFRDYLYIPLGGSKGGRAMQIRNTFIIFLVSGFWHGANWTFIAWGFLNALYFLPLLLAGKNRVHTGPLAEGRVLPGLKDVLLIGITFSLTVLAWVFFRAEDMGHAFAYLGGIFDTSFFSMPPSLYPKLGFFITFLVIAEWLGRHRQHPLDWIKKPHIVIRWGLYLLLLMFIGLFSASERYEFIYFQF